MIIARKTLSIADSDRASLADSSVDAFERFYRANIRAVYSFAAQRLGPTEAEDVTSEVFQAAALAQRDRQDGELTTGWLISVCKNKIIDRWRSESLRKSRSHLIVERFGTGSTPPPDQALDLRDSSVLAALDRTSDRHRTLLILHHIDGMPIAELSTATGLSTSAIESALARARRSFRREYELETRKGSDQ